jgi:chemotaxis protein methyltransferase CheR
MTEVTEAEFSLIAQYIESVCGIALDKTKRYLIHSRLASILETSECDTYHELIVKAKGDFKLRTQIIDALTTHETYFFRHPEIFETLTEYMIPQLLKRPPGEAKNISIWSAACSTGQEVYSIAIALDQIKEKLSEWAIKIVGSDISETSLEKARNGEYTKFETDRGLSPALIEKYFKKDGSHWKASVDLKKTVCFRTLNILDPGPNWSKYDIIFCCNVAIYFSHEGREKLFRTLLSSLKPNGFLVLGLAEVPDAAPPGSFSTHKYKEVRVYRKNPT